ncbi:LPXTG cell wall anchor domain-containing protein [Streptococcus ferus]|uniref:LPXTG cell wall anchor domain-containing protein n=1 Tax=Streptococcus ferus TaxID=1345 RepID=UPI0035A0E2C4
MTKRNVLSTVLLSTLALTLAASAVSADETAAISNPTDVVVTETPQAPVLPAETTEAETPVTDSGSSGAVIDNPTEPVVTETPQAPVTTQATEAETTSAGSTETQPVVTEAETTSQAVTEAKTAEEAKQSGQSQIGTKSTVTGQVVSNVTETEPVQLATGQKIISTYEGQLILANSDGTQSAVSPESVGAKTNVDGTISVKTDKQEMKTLPHTGTKDTILYSLFGLVLVLTGLFAFFPEQFKKVLVKLKRSDK